MPLHTKQEGLIGFILPLETFYCAIIGEAIDLQIHSQFRDSLVMGTVYFTGSCFDYLAQQGVFFDRHSMLFIGIAFLLMFYVPFAQIIDKCTALQYVDQL